MKTIKNRVKLVVLFILSISPISYSQGIVEKDQQKVVLTHIEIETKQIGKKISPLLFGHNLETTRIAVWKGLGAEMVANRKFAAIENGLPKRWEIMGDSIAVTSNDSVAYAGKRSVCIEILGAGNSRGISQEQEALAFRKDVKYLVRIWVKSVTQKSVMARIIDESGSHVIFKKVWNIKKGEWKLLMAEFIAGSTSEKNRLEICSQDAGKFWIGSVSVQPCSAFHGMRADVIELLKRMKPGALRWPGGCYAEFYQWKDGLLPVDQRPPIGPTGLPFLLPDNDDFDPHEIGIDEFIALCRQVGSEPAITVRMSEQTPGDAAELLEYCNGGPNTKWGKIRIARGHVNSYGVKYWFLGNELYYFGRGGLKDPEFCARQTKLFAKAMKAVDPTVILTAVGRGMPDWSNGMPNWNKIMFKKSGLNVDWFSEHNYEGNDAYDARNKLLPLLKKAVADYGSIPIGRQFGITFDEWNSTWGSDCSLPMALNAAGVLSLLCREAESLNVKAAYFFQPVNEGAIKVRPLNAKMKAVGQVFELFCVHQGNRLLKTPDPSSDSDLDVCASLSPGGQEMVVTVINRNTNEERELELKLLDFAGPIILAETQLVPHSVMVDPKALEVRRSWSWPERKMVFTPITILDDEFLQVNSESKLLDGNCVKVKLHPGAIDRLILKYQGKE